MVNEEYLDKTEAAQAGKETVDADAAESITNKKISASVFYGSAKSFPTYEEIISARTENHCPEL